MAKLDLFTLYKINENAVIPHKIATVRSNVRGSVMLSSVEYP